MLESSNLSTSIPAPELECARTFYQDKLGLTPSAGKTERAPAIHPRAPVNLLCGQGPL